MKHYYFQETQMLHIKCQPYVTLSLTCFLDLFKLDVYLHTHIEMPSPYPATSALTQEMYF